MVVGADQEACRAGSGIVDGFADPGIDEPDQGADDVARSAELAELAGLAYLAEHMLEQVALGVGVHPGRDCRSFNWLTTCDSTRRLVDDQAGAVHEVGDASRRKLGVERKDLLPHPVHQSLAVERVRP